MAALQSFCRPGLLFSSSSKACGLCCRVLRCLRWLLKLQPLYSSQMTGRKGLSCLKVSCITFAHYSSLAWAELPGHTWQQVKMEKVVLAWNISYIPVHSHCFPSNPQYSSKFIILTKLKFLTVHKYHFVLLICVPFLIIVNVCFGQLRSFLKGLF